MQGSGAAVTSCSRETTVMAARGVCDHWQGNMLRPEINGRSVAAGSSPVKVHYSLRVPYTQYGFLSVFACL